MSRVAVVVLDTLRKDTFNDVFEWLPGRRYENAWSTSHWTVPAHASLFTGRYPNEVGVYARSQSLDCEASTIAELFAAAGYETVALSTNGHITRQLSYDRGFEKFVQRRFAEDQSRVFSWQDHVSQSDLPEPIAVGAGFVKSALPDYDTKRSLRVLKEAAQRRHRRVLGCEKTAIQYAKRLVDDHHFSTDSFLFLNLMEMHAPYVHPYEYSTRHYSTDDLSMDWRTGFTKETEKEQLTVQKSAYWDTARYLSDQYQQLFDALSNFDLVITLSDHGELFGEHGFIGHGYGVFPELVRIPLAVSGSGIETARVSNPVSLADVFGTLCDFSDLSPGHEATTLETPRTKPHTEYHGLTHTERLDQLRRSELSDSRVESMDNPRYGVVSGGNYIYEPENGEIVVTGADSTEGRALLEERKDKIIPPSGRYTDSRIDPSAKENLEQLGYI